MAADEASQISCLDVGHKSEKIIHKRRSSIFHTRRTCDQFEDGNKTKNENTLSKDEGTYDVQTDFETFDLKKYIEKLKQERKDWQQEYRKRKTQRKNLIKQKTNLEKQGQPLDLNILTEPEKAFLLARPNYEVISKNRQILLDIALKISMLSQLIHKLNKQFMKKMENNISRITRDIIKMSE